MEIRDLRLTTTERGVRAEAEVVWEDADLPTCTLYFETEPAFADSFAASPDAFLLACAPAAGWHGEQRVALEGPVCPVMRDHADAVVRLIRTQHPELTVPRIEVAQGVEPGLPRRPERTGMFLSGGVDALTVLRLNRRTYPLDHPASIREAFLAFGLYGFDVGADGPQPERLAAWRDLRGRMEGLAEREAFTLIPLYTNVRTFTPDYLAWSRALFSPLTAACAHGFASRVSTVLMGSDGTGIEPDDIADSQTLSQCFSSAALEVRLDLVHLDRLARIGLLADWDDGRRLMQPCHHVEVPESGRINCGRCEKCLRTMLGLIVLGRLDETPAFDQDDLTPDVIDEVWLPSRNKVMHLAAFKRPLARAGRRDLAAAIRRRERKWRRKGR